MSSRTSLAIVERALGSRSPLGAIETLERAAERHLDNGDMAAQIDKLRTTYVSEGREAPPAEE